MGDVRSKSLKWRRERVRDWRWSENKNPKEGKYGGVP